MLDKLLGIDPRYPLWLFGLRLAARVSNAILMVFALFLFAVSGPDWPILGYSALILLFCMTNQRAISLVKSASLSDAGVRKIKTIAHLLSAALPVAYVVGALTSGLFGVFALKQAVAVIAPPLLNWLAIEETLRFNNPVETAPGS